MSAEAWAGVVSLAFLVVVIVGAAADVWFAQRRHKWELHVLDALTNTREDKNQ